MRKRRWLLSCLFVLSTSAVSLFAQTPQEIAKNAFNSTVLLVMEDANGHPLSLGSGFFVRESEIATNFHVIEGAARGYARLVGDQRKHDIQGLTAVEPNHDLVILKVGDGGFKPLVLGDSDSTQIGENVYAVGNPRGLEGTFSQGIVSSIRELELGKLLQITAPISPGSSGGPVLNGKGEVIGVSVASIRGGQNLNFAIPSNLLKALIDKTGTVKPLAQVKPDKTKQTILSDVGGRSTEGVVGGQFLWSRTRPASIATYSFSLQNHLRENVKNIYCLVVFYDLQGDPIDVDVVQYQDFIPAGLARRISANVAASVQKMSTPQGEVKPRNFEIRILNFEIVE